MKILILLISAMLFSCTQKPNSVLSEEQKKKIQEKIKPVIAQIYEKSAELN